MSEQLPRERFDAGQVIFRQGDEGENAYLVDAGAVEIATERKGQRVVVARLGPGELFGELALLNESERTATATAAEDSVLIVISERRLEYTLRQASPLLRKLLEVNMGRVSWSQRFMRQHAENDPHAETLEVQTRQREAMEQEIDRGIAEREFELHYQPIINVASGRTAGFEALMRWRHPRKGLVSPGQFIDVAEQSGQIVGMGHWALEESLGALKSFEMMLGRRGAVPRPPLSGLGRWGQSTAPVESADEAPLFMSVNVSGRQLLEHEEVDRLGEVIRASGLDPARIKLEITESLLVDDPVQAGVALQQLRDYGVRIALDDFGTGYSSLSYLHQFPLDTLKIDRSFVSSMNSDDKSFRIVRAIAGMARELDMEVIAEGIERNSELGRLREIGVDCGQGFLMSRPVPFREARKLLKERRMRW